MKLSQDDLALLEELKKGPVVVSAPFHGLVRALEKLRDDDQWAADIEAAVAASILARQHGNLFFFVGNGGSAAIASHMAADWMKTGNMRALCFNDGAALTCLANDLGFPEVFSTPIAVHGEKDDVLFAISSSGWSADILNAAGMAKRIGMKVITLSGFNEDNELRRVGDINFYVPYNNYGLVEVIHLATCHQILDKVVESPKE